MRSKLCPCGSARYLPYALCHDCLRAEREKEARQLKARLFKDQYKPAPEHGIYPNEKEQP